MASERDAAKQSASEEESSDADLTTQLQESAEFRLEQIREEHRHKEAIHKQKLGWLGKFIGGAETGPTVVAFVAVVLFSVIGIGCLAAAYNYGNPNVAGWAITTEIHAQIIADSKAAATFWGDNGKNAFTIALSALGYIFGRGSKSE